VNTMNERRQKNINRVTALIQKLKKDNLNYVEIVEIVEIGMNTSLEGVSVEIRSKIRG
jgi:hypothetical protein